jgi:hypothetical protein
MVPMPAVAMPPVMPVPAAVPVMVMPVTVPAHFLRLETVDFVRRGDRGLDRFIPGRPMSAVCKRIWRQRCRLRARGQRHSAGDSANSEFQKVTAFHDISSFVIHE